MALRPVPWAIGNGAENSVELARADAFVGSSGNTGIVDPQDFHVKQTPVAGAAVRVVKGTGVIRNTYPGAFGQSYVVQEQSYTDVPVAATGSSGGATKYVYVLIEDTQYGGQTPPSVESGPYNSYQVTTTLPSNQPFLLLAKIVQPASTGTITNAMITDLREVANPLVKDVWRPRALVVADTETLTSTGEVGEWFPNSGGPQDVEIPEWATRVQIRCEWLAVRYAVGNVWGQMWVEFGPGSAPSERETKTQKYQFDAPPGSSIMRTNWIVVDDRPVPASYRGTTQKFVPKARKIGGDSSAMLDGISGMNLQLRFLQVAEPSTT